MKSREIGDELNAETGVRLLCVATILKLKLDHTVALCNVYKDDGIFLLINQLIRDLRYLLFLFIHLDGLAHLQWIIF